MEIFHNNTKLTFMPCIHNCNATNRQFKIPKTFWTLYGQHFNLELDFRLVRICEMSESYITDQYHIEIKLMPEEVMSSNQESPCLPVACVMVLLASVSASDELHMKQHAGSIGTIDVSLHSSSIVALVTWQR